MCVCILQGSSSRSHSIARVTLRLLSRWLLLLLLLLLHGSVPKSDVVVVSAIRGIRVSSWITTWSPALRHTRHSWHARHTAGRGLLFIGRLRRLLRVAVAALVAATASAATISSVTLLLYSRQHWHVD